MKPLNKIIIDSSAEKLPQGCMKLDTPIGGRIVFTGQGGWDSEQEDAITRLKVGMVYTVAKIDIGHWKSSVYLNEYPGYGFNTVQFVNVEDK